MKMRTDWQVEALRMTAFPSDINVVSVSRLWDLVIGQDPDAINVQRDVIDAREIKFGNGRIVLAKQSDRIDLHYLSNPDANMDDWQLPIIGKLEEELNAFSKMATLLFDVSTMQSVNRLAFGAVLLFPVNAVEDGHLILEGMLPKMNLQNVRDFFYQINRRRTSTVDSGIEINRLSKWNIYNGQLVTVAVNPMQGQQMTGTTAPSIACRLELDINTFPERTEILPSHKLSEIVGELIGLGLEISESGDIA